MTQEEFEKTTVLPRVTERAQNRPVKAPRSRFNGLSANQWAETKVIPKGVTGAHIRPPKSIFENEQNETDLADFEIKREPYDDIRQELRIHRIIGDYARIFCYTMLGLMGMCGSVAIIANLVW